MSDAGANHRLHLLRHAKASPARRRLSDRDRPLSARGRDDCKLLAAALPRMGIRPDAVIVSPARRTAETYERIRKGLAADIEHWTEKRIYRADAEELLELVRELPEAVGEALVIGHNPALESLALALAGEAGSAAEGMRLKYPTGAVSSFAIATPWLRLRPTSAAFERFLRPKDLRG